MFIVAYLYNNNGMASWCWEAAHALATYEQPVLLICSPHVELPGETDLPILRFELPQVECRNDNLIMKLGREMGRLSPLSSGFTYHLHQHLVRSGITPQAYFLNQSNLQDPRVTTPQYVAAWAYPISLVGYASKIGQLTSWKPSIATVRTCMDTIGWWRKDWRAYHSADAVLAVSQALQTDLKQQGINAYKVHPGTQVPGNPPFPGNREGDRKLLIAAVELEDPRKRVSWMIAVLAEYLHEFSDQNFTLTLVGHCSESFQSWVHSIGFSTTFTGLVSRQTLQTLMTEHDIFLFGSCLDDWGYVLVEALSHGMDILAPAISPFDEILGDTHPLYSLTSQADFKHKLKILLQPANRSKVANRQQNWQRARTHFSREVFGKNLLSVFATQNSSDNQHSPEFKLISANHEL